MALRKLTQDSNQRAAAGPGIADRGDWPILVEYLTTTVYDDGSKREPSALIIVADAGGWRGCLSDKDNGRTLWKSAGSVLELLQALEQAAAEDDPTQWRQSGTSGPKKRK